MDGRREPSTNRREPLPGGPVRERLERSTAHWPAVGMSATFAARRRVVGLNKSSLCVLLSKCIGGEPWQHTKCTECGKLVMRNKQACDDNGSSCGCHDNVSCSGPVATAARLPPPLAVPSEPPSPPTNDQETCADLGISISTFRKLKGLQSRDITPEDYDLLIRLHTKPTTRVLDDNQREKVCVTFHAPTGYVPPTGTHSCAVCLCALAAGEELTQLTCEGKHVFHAHCIREWLETASRCCPVDKQDLSKQCLTA